MLRQLESVILTAYPSFSRKKALIIKYSGVLDTDYDEYAAGMNCYRLNATHTNTQFWILGREPSFVDSKKLETIVLKAEDEWNMYPEDFVFRYNYDCEYDFVAGNPTGPKKVARSPRK